MTAKQPPASSGRNRGQAALKIAGKGKPVFPCKPDKSPYTPRGFKDATTNPGLVAAFWKRHPDAKIGMPTGSWSDCFVVDEDRPKAVDELEQELPETLIIRTPSGGRHFYFKHVDGLTNSPGTLPEGIDIRGEGGYVIVPPSEGYRVEKRAPVAQAPEWLLEKLREKPATPLRAIAGVAPKVDLDGVGPIPEGGRNNTLTAIGGKLRARGLEHEEIEAELLRINAARCAPALEEAEVRRIAASVVRYPAGKAGPDAETHSILDEIEATMWRAEESWKGKGGRTDWSHMVVAFKTARAHGCGGKDGVEFSLSLLAWALAAGTSRSTTQEVIKRLKRDGRIRRGKKPEGMKAGTFILLKPRAARANPVQSNHRGAFEETTSSRVPDSRAPFSSPRLRWSVPSRKKSKRGVVRGTSKVRESRAREARAAVTRMGKSVEQALDYLEKVGGSALLEDLASVLGIARTRVRDLVRQKTAAKSSRDGVVTRMVNAGVAELQGNQVHLKMNWLEALNDERESTGEIEDYRRDVVEYNNRRRAYANRKKNKPDYHPANQHANGWFGDLKPVDVVPAEPPPEPEVSELARVIRDYLDCNPHDACQPPGWLGTTLWAYDLRADKATPAEVQAAIEELGGGRYRRERLRYAEEAV